MTAANQGGVSRNSWQTMDQSPTAGSRSAFAGHAAAGVRHLQSSWRRCACIAWCGRRRQRLARRAHAGAPIAARLAAGHGGRPGQQVLVVRRARLGRQLDAVQATDLCSHGRSPSRGAGVTTNDLEGRVLRAGVRLLTARLGAPWEQGPWSSRNSSSRQGAGAPVSSNLLRAWTGSAPRGCYWDA